MDDATRETNSIGLSESVCFHDYLCSDSQSAVNVVAMSFVLAEQLQCLRFSHSSMASSIQKRVQGMISSQLYQNTVFSRTGI